MMVRDAKKVLDINGAAEYLMFHPLTVRSMAIKGLIGRKIGQRWRFRVEDLDRLLTNDGTEIATRGASNGQIEAGNS